MDNDQPLDTCSCQRVVSLWSQEMLDLVDAAARRRSRASGHRRIGYDEYYQEGCLAAAEYMAREGVEEAPAIKLRNIAEGRMYRLYNDRRRKRSKGREAGVRNRESFAVVEDIAAVRQIDDDVIFDLRAAIETLPGPYHAVIWARYREFRSLEEIADDEETTYRAIGGRVARAFAILREAVEDGYGEAEQRRRVGKPARRARRRRPSEYDAYWSTWGPIPGQRDDVRENQAVG